MSLHGRVNVGEGAYRAGNGAGRNFCPRCNQSRLATIEFGKSLSHLEAKRRWLGVDAMAAANAYREFVLHGTAPKYGQKSIDIFDQKVGGSCQLDR
jgi:hypothetical protein